MTTFDREADFTPFAKAVAKNLKAKIRGLKRAGVVGMSIANLKQVTPTPAYGLEGEPSGPTIVAQYDEIFQHVALRVVVKGFRVYL